MAASSPPEQLVPAAFAGDLPPSRRIFVNRNLRMNSIEAIGFDMDHTLAVYETDNFNRLCFEMAVERLIQVRGYPEQLRELSYDSHAAVRGLIVDKRLGNLLKVDGYGYVSRVRHGTRFLEREERRNTYKRGRIAIGNVRYRVFDTLFDLPEGSLYAAMIDLKDADPTLITASYRVIYDDIRDAVDTIHADGTLKARITADLDRFFVRDDELPRTLRKFREGGKRLFLLTNSGLEYTAAVMAHLLRGDEPWEELFDLVVCSARKPRFFVSQGAGKPVGRDPAPGLANRRGNCFLGGDAFFLESKIGTFGDTILYFGDHTYGDILRSKKSVGWRTAMIVPEVEEEVDRLLPLRGVLARLVVLEDRLEALSMERDRLLALAPDGPDAIRHCEDEMSRILGQRAALQKRLKTAFNPHWESAFKEGRAASRFGRQTEEFACIYTSRVSNFLYYPVSTFFAKPTEVLPHERWAYTGP
ncbi:MAG: HAD-IG family 5'-nucleotidase [Candidatus Krumholzibacteriia bacterium]